MVNDSGRRFEKIKIKIKIKQKHTKKKLRVKHDVHKSENRKMRNPDTRNRKSMVENQATRLFMYHY